MCIWVPSSINIPLPNQQFLINQDLGGFIFKALQFEKLFLGEKCCTYMCMAYNLKQRFMRTSNFSEIRVNLKKRE